MPRAAGFIPAGINPAARRNRGSATDHRQNRLEQDQEDDDDFQQFRPRRRGLVGENLVDPLDRVELALDALLPLLQVEAVGELAVGAARYWSPTSFSTLPVRSKTSLASTFSSPNSRSGRVKARHDGNHDRVRRSI